MSNNKLAIFDFCDTIVNFQSAGRFVEYYLTKEKGKRIYNTFRKVVRKLHLRRVFKVIYPKMSINKQLYLMQLKGCEEGKLNQIAKDYYEKIIKPSLIPETIEELKKVKAEGWKIVIVSGGYDIYIKYFAEEYGVDDFIAGTLRFKNGKFTGTLIEKDCMYDTKVPYTKRLLDVEKISDKYETSRFYSDSETDIPLFMECKERVAVLKKSLYGEIPPLWTKDIDATVIWHD